MTCPVVNNKTQEQSEGNFDRDHLRDQLMDLKERNDKVEGLVSYLENEKSRLQDKVEQMMANGTFTPPGGTLCLPKLLIAGLSNSISPNCRPPPKTKTWCWSWSPCG